MKFTKVQVLVCMAVVAWSGAAEAQSPPTCPLQRVTLTVNQNVTAPSGFDQVSFFNTTSSRPENTPALGGTPPSLPVTALIISTATLFKGPGFTTDQVQLRWGKSADPNAQCLQPFDVQAPAPPIPPVSTSVDVSRCLVAGQNERTKIRTERNLGSKADDFSLIVFCRDLTSFQIDRDYGVEGDPIYVALYDDGTLSEVRIEFPVCSIEQAGPRIFQSETAIPGGVQAGGVFEIKRLAQRSCFDASAQVDLKGRIAAPNTPTFRDISKSHVIAQARRYHATLQVSALFTEQHPHSFGLRVDENNNKRIFDKGPDDRGPEYMATLVIYALPRQLRSLFGGPTFHGRDILHEKRFADRLGGLIGVGAKDPAKSFAAGLSFELLDYINFIAVYRWARLPQLTGVEEDDIFLGTADQIPVRDKWDQHFEAGIAIDLRYVTALFKR